MGKKIKLFTRSRDNASYLRDNFMSSLSRAYVITFTLTHVITITWARKTSCLLSRKDVIISRAQVITSFPHTCTNAHATFVHIYLSTYLTFIRGEHTCNVLKNTVTVLWKSLMYIEENNVTKKVTGTAENHAHLRIL